MQSACDASLAANGITTPPTASAIATAVWTDTTTGDFTTAGSPGYELLTALPAAIDPAAIVSLLVADGVLQYVSGSSGPLQLTPAALAKIPPVTSITTVEVAGRC